MNLSKFKKVKEDKDSVCFVNGDGHAVHVAKGALSAKHRKQIESIALEMQHLDDGGEVAPVESSPQFDQFPNGGVDPNPAPQAPVAAPVPAPIAAAPGLAAPASGEDVDQTATTPTQSTAGLQQQMRGQKALGDALAQEGDQKAAILDKQVVAMRSQKTPAENYQMREAADKQFQSDYANGKINPDKYWDTHSRITAGIGAVLSGLGGGLSQDRGASLNAYMGHINHAIDADIRAQETDKDSKMNLWKMNRQAYGDKMSADLATQAQMTNIAKLQLESATARATKPIEKARGQIVIGGLQSQLDAINLKQSVLQGKYNSPEEKVAALVQIGKIKPPEAAKILEEIKSHRNIVSLAPKLEEAFNLAVSDRRSLKGALPGFMSPGQSALKGLLNTTVNEKEGSGAVAAMKGVTDTQSPGILDWDSEAETKRGLMHNYVKSNDATPFSKAAGIDLSSYPETNLQGLFPEKPKPKEQAAEKPQTKPKQVTQNGHTYTLNKTTGKYDK